jgi:ABC-2 type transport system permease protein
MGAYLIYLQLELKKAVKVLPRFIAGAIVLVGILGTIAFSASKVLYGDTVINRITIGVVLPEEDTVARFVVGMLSSLESVKSVCDFEYTDEETGRELMEEGSYHGLLLVPAGFVDDIISGVNTPITIVLPDDPGMEAMIFKELADSGARTLSVAQASIYAADELVIAYQMPEDIKKVEDDLNQIYFTYALPRSDYFINQKVSATGDVTVMEFYGISAAILFLLFCGIPLAGLCERDKPVLVQKLVSIGINRGLQVGAKILSVAFLLLLVSCLGITGLVYGGILEFHGIFIAIVLLVCLVTASMIVAVYAVTGSPIAGVMSLFWLTVGMLFLSGGLVPSVFLPEAIGQIKSWIPTTPLMEVMKSFVGIKVSMIFVIQSLAWGLICYGAAVFSRRRL